MITNVTNLNESGQGHQSSNEKKMSSREIAEMTGKNHFDLLKSIRKMEPAWEKVTESKFAFSNYKDSTGRTLPMYELSKRESLYVATKFNDEARAKLIIRWEELEEQAKQSALDIESVIFKTLDYLIENNLLLFEYKPSEPKLKYYTVTEYIRKVRGLKLVLSKSEIIEISLNCKALCHSMGYDVISTPHHNWGNGINTYPEPVIKHALEDFIDGYRNF